MSDKNRNPKIDDWLTTSQFGDKIDMLISAEQLVGLALASQLDASDFPEEILAAWAKLIVEARRVVDQSEVAFILESTSRGWSWSNIAERLGLPNAEAAANRSNTLSVELIRTHPSSIPGAYVQ